MYKTIVYVDGFNLFYGALKKTPYKWLNLGSLFQDLLRQNEIVEIKFFTAAVKPSFRSHNDEQDKVSKQRVYWRALKTISNISIIEGYFLRNKVAMPLVTPTESKDLERVIKTEEKGTDVNLACHMLMDGVEDKYDCAVLVSNDSDFVLPLKIIKNKLKKIVGVVNPHLRPSNPLSKEVYFYKQIRKNALSSHLFPENMKDDKGPFSKPDDW